MINTRDAVWALQGRQCACGRAKGTMKSFCNKCYYALPPAMKRALYKRVGQGYEQAYTRALERLKLEATPCQESPTPHEV